MEVLSAIAGIVLLVAVAWDVFESVLLPRPTPSRRISHIVMRITWPSWRGLAIRTRGGNNRERMLGMYAPLVVVALLATWMLLLVCGLGLVLFALRGQISPQPGLGSSIYLAATSVLTIGYGDVVPSGALARAIAVAGGAAGLGVVALVITYLFMLFGSFQSRERLVVAVSARAGAPPSGIALLESFAALDLIEDIPPFFESWEMWASEVLDTHVSYPILGFFRSTHDNVSWISALESVLDAACLCRTTVVGVETGHAELMTRVGIHFVEDISNYLHIASDDGPGVSRDQFEDARERLAAAGYELRDADEAWTWFAKMRTKYASRLAGLAAFWAMSAAAWDPAGKLGRHTA